jgi:hypothetical protein
VWKNQPAIIFIDEIDAISSKRSTCDQQYIKQTLNHNMVKYVPLCHQYLLFNLVLTAKVSFYSQAAIQASKEGYKAVELRHLEWDKVCTSFSSLIVTHGSSTDLNVLTCVGPHCDGHGMT